MLCVDVHRDIPQRVHAIPDRRVTHVPHPRGIPNPAAAGTCVPATCRQSTHVPSTRQAFRGERGWWQVLRCPEMRSQGHRQSMSPGSLNRSSRDVETQSQPTPVNACHTPACTIRAIRCGRGGGVVGCPCGCSGRSRRQGGGVIGPGINGRAGVTAVAAGARPSPGRPADGHPHLTRVGTEAEGM